MIKVTRLNGISYYINSELIETVETIPDTVISLVNGRKYVVQEKAEEIVERVIQYRQRIFPYRAELVSGENDSR